MKSLQIQLKILENKINASKNKISEFTENGLKKEIKEVEANDSLGADQKQGSLDLLVRYTYSNSYNRANF